MVEGTPARSSAISQPRARETSAATLVGAKHEAILASALALGLMTSAALAAPVRLTPAQVDGVKAGQSIAVSCGIASLGVGILGTGSPSARQLLAATK